MAHTAKWLIEGRVALVKIVGDLSIEALGAMSDEIIQYLEAGQAPVHLLIDDEELGRPPIRVATIRKVALFLKHENLGWQVAIGDVNPIANYIVPVVIKLAGVQLVRRKTQEDAMAFLQEHDLTLKTEELA